MQSYYKQEKKGMHPEFSLSRIEELATLEKELEKDLAPLLLTGQEAEKVAEAKKTYESIRCIYEVESTKNPYPKLIADLILSEEEEPLTEMEAIIQEREAIVPTLIDLIKQEKFHDPLFPGFGQTPQLAARCLGRIGDKRAIISLFEIVGQGDFFDDEVAIAALKEIGEPAKEFLLKALHSEPITLDNEKAAITLMAFEEDTAVATTCYQMLTHIDCNKEREFALYLVMASAPLKNTPLAKEFQSLANDPKLPSSIQREIKTLTKNW